MFFYVWHSFNFEFTLTAKISKIYHCEIPPSAPSLLDCSFSISCWSLLLLPLNNIPDRYPSESGVRITELSHAPLSSGPGVAFWSPLRVRRTNGPTGVRRTICVHEPEEQSLASPTRDETRSKKRQMGIIGITRSCGGIGRFWGPLTRHATWNLDSVPNLYPS